MPIWKVNKLSFMERHTLVSSIVAAILTYAMVALPMHTCNEIDKRYRSFLWVVQNKSRII